MANNNWFDSDANFRKKEKLVDVISFRSLARKQTHIHTKRIHVCVVDVGCLISTWIDCQTMTMHIFIAVIAVAGITLICWPCRANPFQPNTKYKLKDVQMMLNFINSMPLTAFVLLFARLWARCCLCCCCRCRCRFLFFSLLVFSFLFFSFGGVRLLHVCSLPCNNT